MTKSKMRIYKDRGFSEFEVDLFMNIDENIVTPHDILEAITDD